MPRLPVLSPSPRETANRATRAPPELSAAMNGAVAVADHLGSPELAWCHQPHFVILSGPLHKREKLPSPRAQPLCPTEPPLPPQPRAPVASHLPHSSL